MKCTNPKRVYGNRTIKDINHVCDLIDEQHKKCKDCKWLELTVEGVVKWNASA